jgi:hypothetical protein
MPRITTFLLATSPLDDARALRVRAAGAHGPQGAKAPRNESRRGASRRRSRRSERPRRRPRIGPHACHPFAARDKERFRGGREEPRWQRRRERRRGVVVAVSPARGDGVVLVRNAPFVLEERALAASARARAHTALARVRLRGAQLAKHGAHRRPERRRRRQRREHRAGTREAQETANGRREASYDAHELESYSPEVPPASKRARRTKRKRAPGPRDRSAQREANGLSARTRRGRTSPPRSSRTRD